MADYRRAYPASGQGTVGLFFSRHTFINTDGSLERTLIEALQAQGLDVLPVFSHGTADKDGGAWGPIDAARRFFRDEVGNPIINALINLQFFFLAREPRGDISETDVAGQSVDLFKMFNVPVFKPVVSYSKSIQEWEEDPQGLTAEVSFGIAMPEFEGHIVPLIMACSRKLSDARTDTVYEIREVIAERIDRITARVAHWVRLAAKPAAAPVRRHLYVYGPRLRGRCKAKRNKPLYKNAINN